MAKTRSKKTAAPAAPQKADGTALQMVWEDGRELPIHHADHMHIQAVPGAFYMSFGQVNLPLFVGAPPADMVVPIRPISRLVVSADAMKHMLEAMRKVVDSVSEK